MKKKVADLHSHTIVSYDSCNQFDWVISRCCKVGINCLAVTDHNEIKGAIEMQKRAPFEVIVGEEVDTGQGEIIGLFLKEKIAPDLGIMRTIEEIKGQEGLVYIPHPLSVSRKKTLNVEELLKYKSSIDIIETFNARTRRESENKAWLDNLLEDSEVIEGAGSDAHAPNEFGNVLIEMSNFTTTDEFLLSLSQANIKAQKTSPWMRKFMNHKTRKIIRKIL